VSSSEQPEQSAPGFRPAPDTAGTREPAVTDLGKTTVTVHRAPRYKNFMILGAIVGVILALAFTVAFPENEKFDRVQIFGFLLLAGVAAGVVLGCIVALGFERVIGRRDRTVVADRLGVNDSRAVQAQDDSSDTQHSNENSE